jgi:hypothetical protein
MLSADAASAVRTLAVRGEALRQAPQRQVRRDAPSDDTFDSASSSDDSDLWLWMLTDIPTSVRTLAMEAFGRHSGDLGAHAAHHAAAESRHELAAPSDLVSIVDGIAGSPGDADGLGAFS